MEAPALESGAGQRVPDAAEHGQALEKKDENALISLTREECLQKDQSQERLVEEAFQLDPQGHPLVPAPTHYHAQATRLPGMLAFRIF